MPQGRKKTPFSGKAKKEQLKAKKHHKTNPQGSSRHRVLLKNRSSDDESSDHSSIHKINQQPSKMGGRSNRYNLQFFKENNEEIARRKELARQEVIPVSLEELEIKVDDYFPPEFDYPKRPEWSYDMSKEQLDSRENKYFMDYVRNLQESCGKHDMSFFELNLETWRQLWRVIEMSDIVLIIADIRYPALMFPPSIYDYVTKKLKKHMILVLNKIDLAPTPLVVAWKHYFLEKYPDLKIVLYTTLPGYNLIGKHTDKAGLQIRRCKGRIRMAAEGTKLLLETCKEIVGDKVDLSSWEDKLKEECSIDFTGDDKIEVGETFDSKNETNFYEHVAFKDGILTIGCIGQPNVGKSSVMNAIMGKKVVSVSRTPGHTKHFQTIFLTDKVRLCDCPGLVFPSKVPKVLQVLMGSFPIAQLREPFTTVKFLAERLDLPKYLRISHPENDTTWSAMDICDGWAKKRGYLTAKAARLDSYRAANSLLRMALDGKICLNLAPPSYFKSKESWEKHPDTETVRWVKAITEEDTPPNPFAFCSRANSTDDENEAGDKNRDSDHNESDEYDDSEDADESDEDSPIEFNKNKFTTLLNE